MSLIARDSEPTQLWVGEHIRRRLSIFADDRVKTTVVYQRIGLAKDRVSQRSG
jgi:hypothetical protein